MANTRFKPQQHLINILKTTANHHPNFTLFLGAGASVTSNVKPARELIREWRDAYESMYNSSGHNLSEQYWYNKPQEYSVLFETLYDQPSQRREFIESCIVESRPSWGYIYLVNLLKKKHFNTIFTTNFDDLVNEACYTFSDSLRPIVCAHDSSINSVRLTSERPKIIKLHGDFLFDNIKNTVRELESLESNMREKFKQYASEFGMIVLGYAGNDRSVMDTLNTLLFTGEHFPHGIYWCVRKNTKFDDLSEPLKALSRFPKFHFVEIDGFDEFFAEVHEALNCELQQEVSDPYSALVRKLNNTFKTENSDVESEPAVKNKGQEIIRSNYRELMNQIADIGHATNIRRKLSDTVRSLDDTILEKLNDAFSSLQDANLEDSMREFVRLLKESNGRPLMPVPNFLLAQKYFDDERYEDVIIYAIEAIKEDNVLYPVHIAVSAMIKSSNFDSFDKLVTVAKQHNCNFNDFSPVLSAVVDLTSERKYDKASVLLNLIQHLDGKPGMKRYLILNRALIDILMAEQSGHFNPTKSYAERLIFELQNAVEDGDDWATLGYAIICDHLHLVEDISYIVESCDVDTLVRFKESQMPMKRLLSDALNVIIERIVTEANIEQEEVEL
ncbi:SIR2 family protein [Vibrio fluvialis]|nr:SIR2 family protein [Vibrio fluvialis]